MKVMIRTGCRLHFGLLASGSGVVRRYGGVGAMLEHPGVELVAGRVGRNRLGAAEARADEPIVCSGPSAERVRAFAQRYRAGRPGASGVAIEVGAAVPEHVGLGSGTQLALAVAQALSVLGGERDVAVSELARRVGRGRRSGIGTHGFADGGLMVESGRGAAAEIAPLLSRVALPSAWRVVLLMPAEGHGLHGAAEEQVFDEAEVMPERVYEELSRRALVGLAAAAAGADFAAFSEGVYEFNRQVGECFAPWQRGAYATARLGRTVEWLRSVGVRGVGQSSWGPTVFAMAESEDAAFQLADLVSQWHQEPARIVMTRFANGGASVEIVDEADRGIARD